MVKISDAELEVMKVIWKRKKATSLEIIQDIQKLEDVTWNFNTIRTLIKRLLVKGAIEVVKKEGKTYTYKATVPENKYKKETTRSLLKKLYDDSIYEFIIQYCENEPMTVEEIKQINQQIDDMIAKKAQNQKN